MTAQPASDVNGSHADVINHPQHYNSHPSGIECIEYAELLPANLSHACVYVWRHADKQKPEEDLAKALWFLDREIGRSYAEQCDSRALLGMTEPRAVGLLFYDAFTNCTPARVRIEDRVRSLRPFVKEKELVASVVYHLLRYELVEARKLVAHHLKAVSA